LLVPRWHDTVALLSLKLDQLYMLLVPEIVVVSVEIRFPSKPDFVQKSLSVWSKFVIVMIAPLLCNPHPYRLVLLVALWHHAIAMFSFKLDQLFIPLVPLLDASRVEVSFPNEPDVVENFLPIKTHLVIVVHVPLLANPHP
jgi:hypothetical protein